MLRLILGILAGAVAAMLLVGGLEAAGHAVYPPPPGLNLHDPAQLAAAMGQIPTAAKAWVVVAWSLGAMGGGLAAALISRRAWTVWVIAGLIVLSGVATMMMIPHPLWMQVGGVAGPLAGGWLAGQLAKRLRPGGIVAS